MLLKNTFIVLTTMIMFFSFTSIIEAHSVLVSSNPKDGSIVSQPLTRIQLTFDSKVEIKNHFKVVNQKGKVFVPDKVLKKDNHLVAGFLTPLESGQYTVSWQIVGEDGHPVHGNISFQIKTGEENHTGVTAKNNHKTSSGQKSHKADYSAQGAQEKAKNGHQSLSPIFIGLIVVLIVIALGLFAWLLKRKK